MLVLNAGQTSHLIKRLPQFELSYETISHKKVSSVYDVCIAIPTGKKMLLWFHNQVNRRLRNPIFTQDDLDKKYKLANTKNIIDYFVQVWSKKTHNPKLMTQDMHKTRAVTQFTEWWKKNYIYFRNC